MSSGNSNLWDASRKLDQYETTLGPHARQLLVELQQSAAPPPSPASIIILAAAIIDVVLREPAGAPARADGLAINKARDSKEAYWLRERRNGIVHYEGGKGGLMGDDTILKKDAIRAIEILAKTLAELI